MSGKEKYLRAFYSIFCTGFLIAISKIAQAPSGFERESSFVDSERLVSWPVDFRVRHAYVSIRSGLPQPTAQHCGRSIRPRELHNVESTVVGRARYLPCRRLLGSAVVARQSLALDRLDGDVFVSRRTVGANSSPGSPLPSCGIASKQVRKVFRRKCAAIHSGFRLEETRWRSSERKL
jgi:hypothetical protein